MPRVGAKGVLGPLLSSVAALPAQHQGVCHHRSGGVATGVGGLVDSGPPYSRSLYTPYSCFDTTAGCLDPHAVFINHLSCSCMLRLPERKGASLAVLMPRLWGRRGVLDSHSPYSRSPSTVLYSDTTAGCLDPHAVFINHLSCCMLRLPERKGAVFHCIVGARPEGRPSIW